MNTTPQSYVLTSQYNEYDQYGAYFIAWFHRKPTAEEICRALNQDEEVSWEPDHTARANRILNNEGRQQFENVWYVLKKVESSNASAAL